jgi:hypothetical protein
MSPLLQKKVLVLNQNYEPLSVYRCRLLSVCRSTFMRPKSGLR